MFWMKVLPEYPDLAVNALKTLLLFPTSYLCESGFSVVAATKTKPRSRLDVRDTLRLSLNSTIPRWERLVAVKQAQGYQSCNKCSLLNSSGFWRPIREKISVSNRSAMQKSLPTPALMEVTPILFLLSAYKTQFCLDFLSSVLIRMSGIWQIIK